MTFDVPGILAELAVGLGALAPVAAPLWRELVRGRRALERIARTLEAARYVELGPVAEYGLADRGASADDGLDEPTGSFPLHDPPTPPPIPPGETGGRNPRGRR